MIESIVRCDNYDQDALNAAVERHFAALRAEELIRPDMRVVIKPNLVGARRPETAATTHPNLVRAVAVWLRARGVTNIVICDSPGGLYAVSPLQNIYAATGMKALSDVAELNADVSFQTVKAAGGGAIPSFNIVTPIAAADLVINIAKLKTHSMTLLSAGVKNLFGCVPGLQKPELHYRHPDIEDFSNMLVTLARTVSPALTLIDAIDGMEGDGPTGGTVRHLGLTLAARDLFTQDWFACSLIGIDPERVAMLRRAKELGLIDERVEIAGDQPIYAEPPFRQPRAAGVDSVDESDETDDEVVKRRMTPADIDSSTYGATPAADFAAERFGLSPREADVLRLLVAGETTAQIQEALCIAPGTFNYHIRNIFTKLGVHSRQELLICVRDLQEQRKQ